MKYDLTQGGIMKKILLVAIPIMWTQLIQMTYNLTDMYWLGKLSSDAVAASGTAGMYMWLSMAFLLLGRMGSEIGVSQNMGRNNPAEAKRFSQNAVIIAAVTGVFFALVAVVFSKELISFFDIKETHVAKDAATYLSIVGLGFPLTFISSAILGTYNGMGNSRMSLAANAAGLIINIIIDPIFIFTFDLGVIGAAVSTVIAQSIVFIIFIIAIKRGKGRPYGQFKFLVKPDFDIISRIVKWSAPIALESLLFTFLAMITTRFVTSFGSDAIAVQRVGSQVESLSWLIAGGFGSAITSFIGQNYGAKKWDRVKKGFKISMLSMTTWGVIVSFVLYFLGRQLFSVFLPDAGLLDKGESYLKILAFSQAIQCIESTVSGVFRGRGKTIPPSVSSISGNVIRVPIAYLLSLTSLGLDGIWWGITIGAALRGITVLIWYIIDGRRHPLTEENA